MLKHILPLAAAFSLGALYLSPSLAEGQLPPQGDRYAWASVAGFAGVMQACADAYPSRKAEYQSRLQTFITEMFGDAAAVRETFDTMMATEEIKEMNRKMIAEIKQIDGNLAQFEEMCGVRAMATMKGTPEDPQAQRALRLRGYLTAMSRQAGYVYDQDKAYGTAANLSGSCVAAAPGSLFSRAGHPPPADPKVNRNRYSNVVGYIETFMREAGTTKIFCYSTPERYAVAAKIPGKTLYDCFDSSGQSLEIANRITGPSCQSSEPTR